MQREMGIFSERPKSFKVHRKSPLASILKSSISNKLLQFLGNYTDDVLAEYIIVLICNGKHQIQARDDLEAFLGERSGEFVSWLWDHLLKHAHQSDSAIGSLDPKDSGVTSPSDDGADRDLTSSRSKYFQNDCNGNVDMSLTKNTCRHPSVHITIPVPSNKVELAKGSQYCKVPVAPSSGANTKKAQLQRQSVIARKVGATENIHDGSLTNKPSKTGGSFLIPVGREESFECLGKSKKNVHSISKGSPSQYLGFSTREMVFKNMEPSIIEYPHAKQTYAANVSARSPPKADEDISYRVKKSRGSVWDRLGKPCKVNDEIVDTQAVDILEKGQEVYDKPTCSVPVRNDELCGSIKDEAHDFDKSSNDNKPGECRKLKQGKTMICELHAANNIQRKRHFGEFSSCLGSRSVSLVGISNIDQRDKENQQDFKRLNSTSDTSDPALVPQVQDVKQRLRQIEIEMSKLRTKQLEMKKDGKPIVLSYSGAIKHSEEDMESRTVFVTNVHFAATKEDLSYHFAKCGVVLHVVILTDIGSGQPKGSAYITFANEESVDKALALSGTSFFSRTLKVSRKAEHAIVTSSPTQHAGKPPQAQYLKMYKANKPLYRSPHLQWRREPASATSIASEKPTSP